MRMFTEADGDGNGYLDPEEFEQLCTSAMELNKEDVAHIISSHDVNADGRIEYQEFIPVAVDMIQAQVCAYPHRVFRRR